MMNHRKSLTSRIWTIVMLAVVFSTGFFGVVSLFQANAAITHSTRQRMIDIANCAAGSVDGDVLERITAEDEGTPEYQKIYDSLAIFLNNIESEYVYGIKVEDDGRFTFTVDPAIDDPGEFGSEIVRTDALVLASQGIPSVDEESYSDAWGTFYSAYSPVFDSKGKVAGIIAVDFSTEWYERQQKEQLRNTVVLFLAVIAIAFFVTGVMCYKQIKAVTNPMKQIADVAQSYQSGDYSRKLEVDRDDELGVLSKALQSMATSLTEQIKKSDSANKAKTNFLANMSHEIRTPINAVLGMNEMITRESNDPTIRSYSENIRIAGSALLSIVNDLLDFSKIDSGKMEIVPVDYDIASVINDLVNTTQIRADAKGLEVKLKIDPAIPKLLHGDAVRIKQVISNILSNAVKYTEKGSVIFGIDCIKIADDPDSVMLEVYVEDTGIGIKPEDIEQLFLEFVRIEEKRNRNIEGAGLGVNITKSLLELMGSTLEVESEYDHGSKFFFKLKQGVVKWEPIGDFENAYHSAHENRKRFVGKITAQRASVLVVDDNEMNLMVLENLLKQTKVQIDTVLSGDEALALLREKKYDIVFLDHFMPDKDGIETLQELKSEKDNPNVSTPVICLTANAIAGAREQYIAAGFDDYLTKPVNPDVLESTLSEYLPPALIDKVDEGAADVYSAEQEESQIPDELKALLGQDIIDIRSGMNNSGSTDAFLSMLKIFYESVDEKTDELKKFFNEEDFKNYTIKVHALKSSARIIGAMDFGEDAQLLENAGKAEEYEFIREHHGELMTECQELKELIAQVLEEDEEDSEDKPVADESFMEMAYERLKKAADDMDCEALDLVFEDMSGYAVPKDQSRLWKKLKAAADSFEYSEILSLIEERN